MADDALGILSKCAFKKDRGLYGAGPAVAYPETPGATSLAATHMVPFLSESISEAVERMLDQSLVGSGRELPADIIARDFSGSLETNLRYIGLERLMMCLMGFESPDTSGGSPDQLGATAAYAHLFEMDESIQDQSWNTVEVGSYSPPSVNDRKVRRGMLGFFKEYPTGGDHVYYSCMVNKLTISGTPSEVKCSWEIIPYARIKGSYNHANWTLPTGTVSTSIFHNGTIKMGTRAGGAGGLATIAPSEFELVIDNGLEASIRTVESGEFIIQPVRSAMRSVSGKFTFPRYDSTLETMIYAGHDLDTEYATYLEFEGPVIVSPYNHLIGLYMTSIHLANPKSPIDSPGAINTEFEYVAARPGASADIFVAGGQYGSITLKKNSELCVVMRNQFTTNYLIEN